MMSDGFGGDELLDLELVGAGLRLRPFEMADLALIKEASADPFIPLLTTVPAIFTPDTGAAFIERQLGRRVDGQGWSLAIHDVAADRAVGQIGLWVGSLTRGRAAVALH